eukprot:gene19032-biopygen11508
MMNRRGCLGASGVDLKVCREFCVDTRRCRGHAREIAILRAGVGAARYESVWADQQSGPNEERATNN